MLASLADITDGFAVDQLTHSLQTANPGRGGGSDDEVVVAALCHDIGKSVSVLNHPKIAAEILRPYVRPEVFSMIEVHQDFQGRHYYEYSEPGPNAASSTVVRRGSLLAEQFAERLGSGQLRSDYPTQPLEHFEAPGARGLQPDRTASKASATRMASVSDRQQARLEALQRLVIDLGRVTSTRSTRTEADAGRGVDLRVRRGRQHWGRALRGPAEVMGLAVTPVVVVDGGDDGTDTVARDAGAVDLSFLPVNLGHGVALRVGYDLCVSAGAQYVITFDVTVRTTPARWRPCWRRWSTMSPTSWWPRADWVRIRPRTGTRKAGVVVFAGIDSIYDRLPPDGLFQRVSGPASTMLSGRDRAPQQDRTRRPSCSSSPSSAVEGDRTTHLSGTNGLGRVEEGPQTSHNGFRYAAVVIGTWRRER